MTEEATTAPPPPRPYPPIHELRRSRDDRKIVGVAGGLGRYAGVDPLIFRILFVVLAVFGGSGILLYALGWLLIPADGEPESEGQRLLHRRPGTSVGTTILAAVVALVLGVAAVGSLIDTGPGLGGVGVLVAVAVIVVLLVRNGQPGGPPGQPPAPAYGPLPAPGPGAYGQTPGTAYAPSSPPEGPPAPPPGWASAPVPPLPPPPAPRERSVLGRATVSVTLIVVGLMVGWNSVSDDDLRVVAVLGAALAVVAGGLLVGSVAGRARGLIVLGILLTVATSISAAADHEFGSGVGERTWAPTTVAAAERGFRLGLGDAALDLTRLPPGSDVDVDVRVGVGELTVLVPVDAEVVVDGRVGAGDMHLLHEPAQGGTDLADTVRAGPVRATGPTSTITVEAGVGLGNLEVRR